MTPNPPIPLSERQARVFLFIERCIASNGFAPTTREVAIHFGFGSTNATYSHLVRLKNKGWIDFQPKLARSIVILHSSDPISFIRGSLRAVATDKSLACFDFTHRKHLLEEVRGELTAARKRIDNLLWLLEEAA